MTPFPDGKFNVLYADPPWSYDNENTGGSMESGASAKYPTMSLEAICEMPIRDICQKDAVLFLWATTPLLPEALQVMQVWGFKYKTKIVWRKIMSLGMGYWFRIQTEDLLVGVKGDVRAFRCQAPNFIQTQVLQHSEKPHAFRRLVERATIGMSGLNRIELFARKKIPGWVPYGNQIEELPTLETFASQ